MGQVADVHHIALVNKGKQSIPTDLKAKGIAKAKGEQVQYFCSNIEAS